MPDTERQQPTSIRYLIVLVTFFAAFLLYLHRFCMTYAQRYIKEDLLITDDQLGFCFSAFFFAYALGQVPAGWLSDRFGARMMLALYVLVWSFFTGLVGFTTGFVMLLVVRMAAGLGQAGAYPTSAALIGRWMPFHRRGAANGIVAFGGRLGGGLAPLLTVFVVVLFVPTSVSSRIAKDDLLDVHHLCFRMTEKNDTATSFQSRDELEIIRDQLGRKIHDLISPETQQAARRLAETYTQDLSDYADSHQDENVNVTKYVHTSKLTLTDPPPESEAILVRDLNVLISGPELSQQQTLQTDLDVLPKEREARNLMARSEKLSRDERERLNRLLLEAIFPNSLKKVYVQGWRWMMFVYGSLGLIVAGLFWFCFRDTPSEHPWSNSAEVALIDIGREPRITQTAKKTRPVPMKHILKSRSLWLICISQWCSNIGSVFLVTWMPRYLLEVHSIPFVDRGLMASIPFWFGWAGMLSGGFLTDAIVHRLGLRWRVLPISLGRGVGSIAYLMCLFDPSVWTVIAFFAVVSFTNDVGNPSSWAYKQDVGGEDVGSIHGWANMWGNLGATVSPLLLQYVIKNFGWDYAFMTCAGGFLLAAVAALGVDARIPIVPKEKENDSPITAHHD